MSWSGTSILRFTKRSSPSGENIFDLAAYLQQNDLPHALAHPLFSINDKLTVAHFEKFLLLFKTMEMNGARDEYNNRLLRAVFGESDPGGDRPAKAQAQDHARLYGALGQVHRGRLRRPQRP